MSLQDIRERVLAAFSSQADSLDDSLLTDLLAQAPAREIVLLFRELEARHSEQQVSKSRISRALKISTEEANRANDELVQEIGERKRAEKLILRQNAVMRAINTLFRETLTCDSDEQAARVCLAVAEELTGSRFGWIGEVNQAGRLDTIALSDPGWDACRMPRSDAGASIQDLEIQGIWGEVIKSQESLIVNDPGSHPARVGIPEGHPPLTCFLGVPLQHAGKTTGMIALANKASGYHLSDQEDLEALSAAFVQALMRKRAEEEVRRAKDLAEEAHKAAEVQREVAERRLAEVTEAKRRLEVLTADVVEREKRMIELKREVNGLLVAAGKASRYDAPERVDQVRRGDRRAA